MSCDDHAVQLISIDQVRVSHGGQKEDKTLLQRSQHFHQGEFWHISVSAQRRSQWCRQNLRWPFMIAILSITVGSGAWVMADNGEAKGLISLPQRWVSDNCPVRTRAAGVKQCRCVRVCVCVCACMRVSAKKYLTRIFISKNQPGVRHSDPLKSSPGSHSPLFNSDSLGITSSCSLLVSPLSVSLESSRLCCLCFSVSIHLKLVTVLDYSQ